MNEYEYKFLTGKWEGIKGAAYNEVFEFCRNFGWCVGFDASGRPVLTRQGAARVRAYQTELNYKRVDAI